MSRSNLSFEINSIVKGLVTEASPLNFPQDASIDEVNFVLNRDGSRQRRLGMDYEDDALLWDAPSPNFGVPLAYNTYIWGDIEGYNHLELVVVQSGATLRFFESGVLPLSRALLFEYVIPSHDPFQQVGFSSMGNSLVVVLGSPTVIIFDVENGSLSPRYERIKVRDVFGIEDVSSDTGHDLRDGNHVSERPTTLTDQHLYNLRNQTWATPMREAGNEVLKDTIKSFRETPPSAGGTSGFLPSNADNANAHMSPLNDDEDDRVGYRFIPVSAVSESPGTSDAPRGHFIIDLLSRSFSRYEEHQKYFESWNGKGDSGSNPLEYNITDLPLDLHEGGPSVVSTFAGRFWYSGFNGKIVGGDRHSPKLGSFVCFSQLVSGTGSATSCYQQGDPTSRTDFDLVDSDGGFIPISGARIINKMVPYKDSLLVFSENGVWAISGGSGYGFTATDYRVDKLTTAGCVGPNTVVLSDDAVYYWSPSGVSRIGYSQNGTLTVEDLTKTTIQTFYNNIDSAAKSQAFGIYEENEGRVRWVYNDDECSKELVLDIVLGAFYPAKITNRVLSVEDYNMLYTTDGDNFIQLNEERLDTSPSMVADVTNVGGTYFLTSTSEDIYGRHRVMKSPDDFAYDTPVLQAVYENPTGTTSFGKINDRFYGLMKDFSIRPDELPYWHNLLIATSVDGTGWQEGFFIGRPSSVVVAGTPELKVAVCRASSSEWGQAAVRFGTPLYVSENGGDWRIVDDPVLRNKNIEYVLYHDGRFIASVFDDANKRSLAISSNGYNWQHIQIIIYIGVDYGTGTIDRIIYGNGKYLAFGDGNYFHSDDALSWSSFTTNFLEGHNPHIEVGNGVFVYVDADNFWGNPLFGASYSTNGRDWTFCTPPSPAPSGSAEITSFLFNGTEFVLTTSDATNNMYRSVDGDTWTVSTIVGPQMSGVINAGDIFVGHSGGNTYTSTDGINWTFVGDDGMSIARVQYANKIGDTYWFDHGFFSRTDDWSEPLVTDSFSWPYHRGWRQLVGDGTRVVGLCVTVDPLDPVDTDETKPVSYYTTNGRVFIPSTTRTEYSRDGVLFHSGGKFLAASWDTWDMGPVRGDVSVYHSTDGDVWQQTSMFIDKSHTHTQIRGIANNSTGIVMLMGEAPGFAGGYTMKAWRDNSFWEDLSQFFPSEFTPMGVASFKNRVYVTGWWFDGTTGRAQIYSSLNLRIWDLEWNDPMPLAEGINYLSSVATDGESLVFKGVLDN